MAVRYSGAGGRTPACLCAFGPLVGAPPPPPRVPPGARPAPAPAAPPAAAANGASDSSPPKNSTCGSRRTWSSPFAPENRAAATTRPRPVSRLVNPETRRDAARTNIPETAVAGVAPAASIATRPDARSEKCAKRRFPRRFEDARADDREVLVRTTAPKTLPEAVAALAGDINQRMRSRSSACV